MGRVARTIDPRGHDTLYVYNELDQVVRDVSREVSDASGVRYERDTFYDANDKVVRTDIQNKNDAGVLQTNTHFTTVYEYDILNYRTRTCEEVGDYTGAIPGTQQVPTCTGLPESEFITTEYEYDANRNPTLMRNGEAVEGRQPTNETETRYDERDLTFQEIRGPGDPDQSTTQYDYDQNRNLARTSQGIEDVPAPRITNHTFDGYDRSVSTTDPMGNVMTYHYDANSNRVSSRTDGELIDILGDAGNVRLSEMTYIYDPIDRLTRTDVEFFDSDTQTPIDDGKSTTQTFYSDNSQVTRVVNDNAHQGLTAYDTANRRSVVTDAKGNTVNYTYDANSNVTAMVELEKSDLGNPDERFTTTYAYDNLDRLIQTVDNVDNTHAYAYDSRDNRTVMTDALDHETRTVYDGINRLTETIRDMDDDGADGDGTDITTTQAWDDTSRLIEQGDDNGNVTRYAYDALNRLTSETYADNTVHSYTYDVHDNRLTKTDANGSVAESADLGDYDLLDRLTRRDITLGPGVSNDTTFEVYKYDGLSRLVHAEDDDSLTTRSYDSLSRVTSETLNGQTTTCGYDGVGNELSSIYPGGRQITCTFDELERRKTITDTTGAPNPIADYDYVGPGRVERREYGNGTRTDYAYDGITGTPNPANDFGVKRIIGTNHTRIAGGVIIDNRTFAWDKMYNKTRRKDDRTGGPQLTHDYSYDAIYRLIHTTVTDATVAASVVRDTDYDLDGVGNRELVSGTPDPGPYTMDAAQPEPADRQMNQYTTTSFDARQYDKNGNLIEQGVPVLPPLQPGPNPWDPDPKGGRLNRAGSFKMPSSAAGQNVTIRITLKDLYIDTTVDPVNGCPVRTGDLADLTLFNGQVRYLGPPSAFDDNALSAPKFIDAELQCTPFYRDWSPAALTADFGAGVDTSTIYYYGAEVFPCSVHEAQYAEQGGLFSNPLEIRTALWGDVWPSAGSFGQVNFTDIGKIVDAFKSIPFVEGPPPAGAPRKVRAMLRENSAPLDSTINFTDIGKVVDAFKTIAYAEDGPESCPTAATAAAAPLAVGTIRYDYRNQMVEFNDTDTGRRHTYAYDALGRRIQKVVDAGGAANTTRYFYDGWQVVEEQNAEAATQGTYVYGLYIDEVLNMQRSGVDYYYHTDDLYNVMAITDAAGAVVERYEYADYGQAIDPTTLAPIVGDPSAVGNPYGFTGRRYDPETGWYYYRTRYLDPTAGRFTTRDTIGAWGDVPNLGNSFAYVGSNPAKTVDPHGTGPSATGCENLSKLITDAWKVYNAVGCCEECTKSNACKTHFSKIETYWQRWLAWDCIYYVAKGKTNYPKTGCK